MPLPPSRNRMIVPPISNIKTQRVLTEIMKVGQYPAPTIKISRTLRKALGPDATTLYTRALISRNNGFGLAAVGYIRRVVEDKTNELIEVSARVAEASGEDLETVAQIRAALDPTKYATYKEKLKTASEVFPVSLKVDSVNPLQLLFSGVSEALHSLSEPRCIEVADEIRFVFEYVFEKLKAQVDARREFEEKVRKLS